MAKKHLILAKSFLANWSQQNVGQTANNKPTKHINIINCPISKYLKIYQKYIN